MPYSLRLDPGTEATLRRLSSASGRSKADVVREAVAQYAADREPTCAVHESAFDRLKPIIGIVRTGGANYSVRTHAKYRQLLRRKHRARGPR